MAYTTGVILLLEGRESGPAETTPEVKKGIFVSIIVGMIIAISTTLLRLLIRRTRLWYDDLFALLGLVSFVVGGAVAKTYYDYSLGERNVTPRERRVAIWYTVIVTFNTTIWLSRLSILFSIIRLGSYQRRLYATAACFVLVLFLLVAQLFWVCEPQNRHTNWKADVVPKCILGKSVAIAQITTDALADIVLVTVPLLILRHLQSAEGKALKVRLTAVFVVGGLTTVVSAVHARYLIKGGKESIIPSQVELAVSVIISNLAVLAAFGHRLWNKYHPGSIGTVVALRFGSPLPERSSTSMSVSVVETRTRSDPEMGSREDASSGGENRDVKVMFEVFGLDDGEIVPVTQKLDDGIGKQLWICP